MAKRCFTRRWRQFGLRTLLLLPVLVAIGFAWPYVYRCIQIRRLAAYESQDLWKLDYGETQRVQRLIESLAPSSSKGLPWDLNRPQPWYVWCPETAEPFLILLQGRPGLPRLLTVAPSVEDRPSCFEARLSVFEPDGKLTRETTFLIPHEFNTINASFDEGSYGFPCVKVEGSFRLHGKSIRSQYYALVDNRLTLLRLEDRDGNVMPFAQAHRCGPKVPRPTIAQWQEQLASSDRIAVLSALACLPVETDQLIASAEFRAQLSGLAESEDAWISESATAYWSALDSSAEARARLSGLAESENVWISKLAAAYWSALDDPCEHWKIRIE